MSTSSIRDIWKLVEDLRDEIDVHSDPEALRLLIYVGRHQGLLADDLAQSTVDLVRDPRRAWKALLDSGFGELRAGRLYLTEKGRDLSAAVEGSSHDLSKLPPDVIPDYVLQLPPLGRGSTSVTFKAKARGPRDQMVVVKVFRPGIVDSVDFERRIKEVRRIRCDHLVTPLECGDFQWGDTRLRYLAMHFIKGDPLRELLRARANLDIRLTLRNYIREVGGAITAMQENGFTHGDLHDNNILVVPDDDPAYGNRGIFHFKIVDFVGLGSSEEARENEKTDFDFFVENFAKIVHAYCTGPSGDVDKKRLGPRYFRIYERLTRREYATVDDVLRALSENMEGGAGLRIEEPFTCLIFENYDIANPGWLLRFEPDPALYAKFVDFGPLMCSGPRGGGKTIYLRSLSFVPQLIAEAEHSKDVRNRCPYFRGVFGIYFPCRQGEFKYLTAKQYDFGCLGNQLFLKHILTWKIIRRTISLIAEGYQHAVFSSEPSIDGLISFMRKHALLKRLRLSSSAREAPLGELATLLRNEENHCIDKLGHPSSYPPMSRLLNEHSLMDFFKIARDSVPELRGMRFYVIFDDMSEPQVNLEVQKILNCFMACPNEVYCCKFSTEKYAYTCEDMFGKAMQVPHDFAYADMSTVHNYAAYLERIVNRQLKVNGYRGQIKDYLENLPYGRDRLLDLLTLRLPWAKGARYAGWDLLVQLSSESVRDGIAICDAVFRQHRVKGDLEILKRGGSTIPVNTQDLGIRKYSQEVYASLIDIESVGKEIFDIVRNFGMISREYLKRKITKQRGRRYEMITIERSDSAKLSPEAARLLGKLIRYSVFLDAGFSFSREHMGLVKKFTLHKKYTPRLETTFRAREHLRLLKDQLEGLLLQPDKFRVRLLHRLHRLIPGGPRDSEGRQC